jgi:prepilin peptidase CpaA
MTFLYPNPESLAMILLALMVLFAANIDLKSNRIPNKITFPAILIGLAFHTWLNGFSGFMFSLKGAGLGLAIFIIPYLIGKIGAGDAKLMGAVGAFLGVKGVIIAFIYISFAGGIYLFILILFQREKFRGFFTELFHNFLAFVLTRKLDMDNTTKTSGRPCLCYGVAIAAGTWLYIGLELFGVGQLVPL